ncbi:unnamed protein product [Rotaria sp. Silwood1]|nr:unnamed protein product [Rotaria sp. Silwood1]CAF1404025.1 unnamed protein product [Rotaria sp. Silwood1]CAF3512664.1 unnamed protein product [Rotaria sp. Silwood1]CAF3589133.1 unnamed protein product [Rotaria sp. Silwood1]CAF3612192.1 unnamed protein product [Rotaria sp. Silwood1]
MTTNRSVPIVVISSENIPNKIRNIDDIEYELSQNYLPLKSTPSRKSKGRSLIKYKSAPPVPIITDENNDIKENEITRLHVISHILPRFPVRHGILKQKRKYKSKKKILAEKTSDNIMQQENMDKILLEPNLSNDENETTKKKQFKSNLIQLTPDDLQQTALKIQEKYFHGKTSEYLMINVLNGNEFDEWFRYLRAGFNILLHGVGSKKSLVSLFFKKYLKNEYLTFIINGFLPNITIKQVLQTICSCAEINISQSSNNDECIRDIIKKIEKEKLHIYLLINNIDGMNFRNINIQNIFKLAAQCQYIHILATIDHIHGPLIWNQQSLNSFRWIWYAVHTWLPYIDETTNERLNTIRLKTSQLSISAVEHVIESLTPNARRIFRLLVEAFLANSNSKDYEGMKFTELYEQCKRSFYVNNEQNLRLQLIEFIDHRLIKLGKSTNDGQEIVRLLITEQDIVQQLLDKLK